LPYQRPSSSADCARELFSGSNGSASLVDCQRKKKIWGSLWVMSQWEHVFASLSKYTWSWVPTQQAILLAKDFFAN